jgi:glycosyltransferase involved in cell wall biosynthesis
VFAISCFIITQNDQHNIARAINSVSDITDEIIVVDNGSVDGTCEIALGLGAKVVQSDLLDHNFYVPFQEFLHQKKFAEGLCRNQWILNINANEELTPDLRNQISSIFFSEFQEKYQAYLIKCVAVRNGSTNIIRNAVGPYNKRICLYNTAHVGFAFNNNSINDDPHFKHHIDDNLKSKKIFTFHSVILHHYTNSIDQLIAKVNLYSSDGSLMADEYVSNFRLCYEFIFSFLNFFFIQRYFVFGMNGVVDSMIFAFAKFLRVAKIREKQNKL